MTPEEHLSQLSDQVDHAQVTRINDLMRSLSWPSDPSLDSQLRALREGVKFTLMAAISDHVFSCAVLATLRTMGLNNVSDYSVALNWLASPRLLPAYREVVQGEVNNYEQRNQIVRPPIPV